MSTINSKGQPKKGRKTKPELSIAYGRYFIHEHSLSLAIASIMILFKIAGYVTPQGYWQDTFNGFGDDAWGAFLIVIATKYFIEAGSPESKK